MPDGQAGNTNILLVGFGALGAVCESHFRSFGYACGSKHLGRCLDSEEKWANSRHRSGS